jgi:hypothetical protein
MIFVMDLPLEPSIHVPATEPLFDANMLALMTYMGHGQVDSTYWYLHATPRMLAQVSEMSEAFGEGGQS